MLKRSGDTVTLPALPKRVIAGELLTGGEAKVEQTATALRITVPAQHQQAIDTIVKLRVDGPAWEIAPLGKEEVKPKEGTH